MAKLSLCALVLILLNGIGVNYAQIAPNDAEARDGRLRGSVADETGGFIDAAYVIIHRHDMRTEIDSATKVGAKGLFEFSLQPGLYDVLVASNGFVPLCKKIEIVSGRDAQFKAVMHPDTEHMDGVVTVKPPA